MRHPRAYIAGPMRGLPQHNFPAFFEVSADLEGNGWDVHNPAAWDMAQGFDPDGKLDAPGGNLSAAMRHDLEVVLGWADVVVVLPGWEGSIGARLEVAVAQAIGKPVYRHLRGVVTETVSTAVA